MTFEDLKKIKDAKIPLRDPIRRIFYLEKAARNAENLEFKKLWLDKKAEVLQNL